ncbi:MAG: hypothetical protein ACPG4T_06025, partial [Nannocystaceae bacterium]
MTVASQLVLGLCLASGSIGCKRDARTSPTSPSSAQRIAGKHSSVLLPEPLPIPATPEVGLHLAAPGDFFTGLAAWVPIDPSRVPAGLLREQMPAAMADAIAPHVSTEAAWDAMRLPGVEGASEELLHLPLMAGGVKEVAQALSSLETQGNFGARVVPAAEDSAGGPTRLVFLDEAAQTLTIATTERGLATGQVLAGVQRPAVWARVDGAFIRQWAQEFPFAELRVEGAGLHDVVVTAGFDPAKGPLDMPLVPGALTGLLDAPGLAVGATARWSEHRVWVKQTLAQLRRQVDKAGFAAQMVLGKLVSQTSTLLRSWNGKVFVGVGPKGHVVFGFGTDDPAKTKRAALGALDTAIGNLSMLRMFASNVPRIGLKKLGDGHLVTVVGVKNSLGPELAALLDDRGRLRIAFTGDASSGALFGAIGADAPDVLGRWVGSQKQAMPAKQASEHLVAAQMAVDARTLAPVLPRFEGG